MANTWLPAVFLRLRENTTKRSRADALGRSFCETSRSAPRLSMDRPLQMILWEECRVSVTAVVALFWSHEHCEVQRRLFTPPCTASWVPKTERKREENACSIHVETKHCTFCTLDLYKCCPFCFCFFVSVTSMSERILQAQHGILSGRRTGHGFSSLWYAQSKCECQVGERKANKINLPLISFFSFSFFPKEKQCGIFFGLQ